MKLFKNFQMKILIRKTQMKLSKRQQTKTKNNKKNILILNLFKTRSFAMKLKCQQTKTFQNETFRNEKLSQ